MLCTHPYVRDARGKVFYDYRNGSISKVSDLSKGIPIPCGQCMACRINKRRMWTARLLLESKMHDSACFLTLTYDDDHNPGQLVKRDIQLFLKRLRFYLDHHGGFKLRYYICGEYGEMHKRPHYHAILFGVPEIFCSDRFFERFWIEEDKKTKAKRLGMCYVGYDCSSQAMRYVAGYVTKKYISRTDPMGPNREPEFSIMSRKPGVGVPALQILADALKAKKSNQHRIVSIDGKSYYLGRTLSNKLARLIGVTVDELCDKKDSYYLECFEKFFDNEALVDKVYAPLATILVEESAPQRNRVLKLQKLFDKRLDL